MILQEGSFTIMDLTKAVKEKYKKPLASCTNEEIYICLLEQVKKLAKEKEAASKITAATSKRKLYYISAEFLIGKLLSNNLINLGLYDEVKKELAAAGQEPCRNRGAGTGAIPRQRWSGTSGCLLYGCLATLGLPGEGIGLNYHLGLFKQVFKDRPSDRRKERLDREGFLAE